MSHRQRGWVAWLPLLLLCLAATPAVAQPALEAEAAVQQALAQSDVAAIESAQRSLAEADQLDARLWPNPYLQIERERSRGAPQDEDETRLLLRQEFDMSGQRRLRREAAQLGMEAMASTQSMQRSALRAQVLTAFHEAAAAAQQTQSRRRALANLGALVDGAQRREREGDLSGFERQRIEQQARVVELQLGKAEAEERAARARLAGWIGESALNASLQSTPPAPWHARGLQSEGPEIGALQAALDQAEARLRAERRLRLPVQVGIGQIRVDTPGMRERAVVVEAELPLPLFERNQSGVLRALSDRDRAEAELTRARRAHAAQRDALQSTLAPLIESARQLREALLPQARALSLIARASFDEGELDLLGLLETLRTETELESLAIEETLRAHAARIALEHLTSGDNP